MLSDEADRTSAGRLLSSAPSLPNCYTGFTTVYELGAGVRLTNYT